MINGIFRELEKWFVMFYSVIKNLSFVIDGESVFVNLFEVRFL